MGKGNRVVRGGDRVVWGRAIGWCGEEIWPCVEGQ